MCCGGWWAYHWGLAEGNGLQHPSVVNSSPREGQDNGLFSWMTQADN